MAGTSWRTVRGVRTREKLIQAAIEILQTDGIFRLTMRAVSEATSVPLSSIQYHYGARDDFTREVVRCWSEELTHTVGAAAADARGLARTLRLCRSWVGVPDVPLIAAEAARLDTRWPGLERTRAMFLSALGGWVDLTHQSLRQAKATGEVVREIDAHALAIELHQLVWSHGWTTSLVGADASARGILQSVWDRLHAVSGSAHSLPALGAFLDVRSRRRETAPPQHRASSSDDPMWKTLLTPDDPLFQALDRHELMGNPKSLIDLPEILPEDIAAAKVEALRMGVSSQ